VADDCVNGSELWKSDGTEAGTVLIKDINFGANNSAPSYITKVGRKFYFVAIDDIYGRELWMSDGTEVGTIRMTDVNSGSGNGVSAILRW
jgi:ELWxxDGT repeat protein